LIDIKYKAV